MAGTDTVNTAVQQTSDTAQVVDKIAQHLGEAAGNLASKFSQIIDQYGPNAAQLIHEIGRVTAIQAASYMVLHFVLFCAFGIYCVRSWNKLDAYYKGLYIQAVATTPADDLEKGFDGLKKISNPDTRNKIEIIRSYESSLVARMIISGFLTVVTGLALLCYWSISAIYGIFSPEAFLVLKLLKWA